MAKLSRREYAQLYGPTTGDGIRLGDTELIAEVEFDHAVPGDECLHGGGKTLRDGLGLVAGYDSAEGALDFLLSNVVLIDPVVGIVKGDIGIKDGRIVAIGKAGNPAIMDGVHPKLICGAATTVRDGEGMIATPGGIDVHVHFDSAQLVEHAISSGLTTMIGGSLGPITVGIDSGGAVQRRQDAAGGGAVADQFRLPRPRQFVEAEIAARPDQRRVPRTEDPRGLGRDARRDRHVSLGRRRTRLPGAAPHRHAERIRLPGGHARRHRRPDDPHVSHGRRGRRARAGHHPRRGRAELPAVVDQPDESLHR